MLAHASRLVGTGANRRRFLLSFANGFLKIFHRWLFSCLSASNWRRIYSSIFLHFFQPYPHTGLRTRTYDSNILPQFRILLIYHQTALPLWCPMKFNTAYLGGISTSMCKWSKHTSTSTTFPFLSIHTVLAKFHLSLFASDHKTLSTDISAKTLYGIYNSSLYAINYLHRSLQMSFLCLVCAAADYTSIISRSFFPASIIACF